VSVDHLRQIPEDVRSGAMEVETALAMLRDLPYEGLGFAKLDHHRALRQGVPEVVFCQGKTTEQVVDIMGKLAARNRRVMATRANLGLCGGQRRFPVSQVLPASAHHRC
jgi:NCAIR mutase (PurE)-related protein